MKLTATGLKPFISQKTPRRTNRVTAYTYEDALAVLAEKLFRGDPIPPVRKVTEDVDVSTLDAGHVLPNIGVPTWRGVWFPRI